jgi:hypothetical protein
MTVAGGSELLDERITRFVSDGVRFKSLEFDQELAASLLEIDTGFARAGQFRSGLRVANCLQRYRQDLRRRAEYVFGEIKRALELYPRTPDNTLKNNLVGLLFTEIRGQATHLQRTLQERFSNAQVDLGRAYDDLNTDCTHLTEQFSREIGALVDAATSAEAERRRPAPRFGSPKTVRAVVLSATGGQNLSSLAGESAHAGIAHHGRARPISDYC